MSETSAYRTLRKNIVYPYDRLDRIENLIGLGFPDTNGCFNCREFWIEIKSPIEPKRPTTPLFGSNHKMSQEQKNWFLRQRRAGGHGWIYIETDKRRILLSGGLVDIVNTMTVDSAVEYSSWYSKRPTTPLQWDQLHGILCK